MAKTTLQNTHLQRNFLRAVRCRILHPHFPVLVLPRRLRYLRGFVRRGVLRSIYAIFVYKPSVENGGAGYLSKYNRNLANTGAA